MMSTSLVQHRYAATQPRFQGRGERMPTEAARRSDNGPPSSDVCDRLEYRALLVLVARTKLNPAVQHETLS